jgi:hypothetical protein
MQLFTWILLEKVAWTFSWMEALKRLWKPREKPLSKPHVNSPYKSKNIFIILNFPKKTLIV